MVANIFVHQSSLKRVRFERKAIEKGIRDSNPELTESQTLEAVNQLSYPHLDQSQDRMFRSRSLVYPSYSAYRESRALAENRTYSTNCLNKGVSLTNYLSNFDSSLTPVLESRPRNGYVTPPGPARGGYHQPLQRSYSEPIQTVPDSIDDSDDYESPRNGMLRTQSVRREVVLSDWSSPKRNSFKIGNSSKQYEVSIERVILFHCWCVLFVCCSGFLWKNMMRPAWSNLHGYKHVHHGFGIRCCLHTPKLYQNASY